MIQSIRRGIFVAFAIAAFCATAANPAFARADSRNVKTVEAFYEAAINQKNFDAAATYLGPEYRQHNPSAADGREGLKAFIANLKQNIPNYHSEIKRIFSDGDYVIVHVHNVREPGARGTAIIDIFRLDRGKIVEHWDVRQDIPETAANSNGMF